jgi:hypothetical protein
VKRKKQNAKGAQKISRLLSRILRDCKICSRLAGTAKKKGAKKTVHGSAREKEEKIKGRKKRTKKITPKPPQKIKHACCASVEKRERGAKNTCS